MADWGLIARRAKRGDSPNESPSIPEKGDNAKEGNCLTLNMIERLSAEPIQQKQGLRENDSTSARDKD